MFEGNGNEFDVDVGGFEMRLRLGGLGKDFHPPWKPACHLGPVDDSTGTYDGEPRPRVSFERRDQQIGVGMLPDRAILRAPGDAEKQDILGGNSQGALGFGAGAGALDAFEAKRQQKVPLRLDAATQDAKVAPGDPGTHDSVDDTRTEPEQVVRMLQQDERWPVLHPCNRKEGYDVLGIRMQDHEIRSLHPGPEVPGPTEVPAGGPVQKMNPAPGLIDRALEILRYRTELPREGDRVDVSRVLLDPAPDHSHMAPDLSDVGRNVEDPHVAVAMMAGPARVFPTQRSHAKVVDRSFELPAPESPGVPLHRIARCKLCRGRRVAVPVLLDERANSCDQTLELVPVPFHQGCPLLPPGGKNGGVKLRVGAAVGCRWDVQNTVHRCCYRLGLPLKVVHVPGTVNARLEPISAHFRPCHRP